MKIKTKPAAEAFRYGFHAIPPWCQGREAEAFIEREYVSHGDWIIGLSAPDLVAGPVAVLGDQEYKDMFINDDD